MKQVYTDRKFDFHDQTMLNTFDPTLGVQRFYWTQNFRPGVPFTNGSHYSNPEVDKLLEAAQVEVDAAKRADLFHQFQAIIARDLPALYLVDVQLFTVYNKRVNNHTVTADGIAAALRMSI